MRAALHRAVDTYGGEFAAGTDYLWAEPVREDLHRRALDAHLRLAELEDVAHCPDAAIGILERAVGLDGCAEEPFRRLMTLQAGLGMTSSVRATWHQLQRNLAGLDVDSEPATARLYRQLTDKEPIAAARSPDSR